MNFEKKQIKVELIEDHTRSWSLSNFVVRATDEFGVSCDLKFTWNELLSVEIFNGDATELAGTFDFDLVGRVMCAIVNAYSDEHEMYSDVFYDANGENSIVLTAL